MEDANDPNFVKVTPSFRINVRLEHSVPELSEKDKQTIAEILDENANFTIIKNRDNFLRQINLYIHCYDYEDLLFIKNTCGIKKKIFPLGKKYFLGISMTQAYSLVKRVYPYSKAKKMLFKAFMDFHDFKRNQREMTDLSQLQDRFNHLQAAILELRGTKKVA